MALPTIVLNNATGSAIELKQLAVIVPASGSVTVSDYDTPAEVLNDEELQVELDAGNITVTFQGAALTSEQSKALIQPITALDIKHNLTAVVIPDPATDDDVAGYSVGSQWINTATRDVFLCVDNTTGAAVWNFMGPAAKTAAMIAWGNNSVGGTIANRYMDPWGAQNQIAGTDGTTNPRHVAVRDGFLRYLYVRHGNPDGNGNDITYTVRVNGVATSLTVTLASTGTQASNLVDVVVLAEGDNIDVEITKLAGIGNSPDGVTLQCEFL
jgi:hypothetical protein